MGKRYKEIGKTSFGVKALNGLALLNFKVKHVYYHKEGKQKLYKRGFFEVMQYHPNVTKL